MRKHLLKLLSALTVATAVFGMAASLGGVNSGGLGAEDAAVGSCDSDGVATSFGSGWDNADNRYEMGSVTVSGVSDACDGKILKVALTDSVGSALAEGALSVPTSASTSHTVTMSNAPASKMVTSVHVSIG